MLQTVDPLRPHRIDPQDRDGARNEAPADDGAALVMRSRLSSPVEPGLPEALIRKLAADHLRELRDDGLTVDYVARMYGVSAERMEILYRELLPSPPR